MSDSAQTRDSMYCHGCHHQWQRQGEDIECPTCHSASTEIITSEDDPRHFHRRQAQQPEPATTYATVYGPERPPSATPPQSNSRPSSRNGSTQGNNNTQRHAPATHQFIFAPMTFHFTIISDRAPPPPQAQPQQASTTQEQQQQQAPRMAWTDFALPFFMPPFHAPPPPPANTTTNSPPAGSAEGASPSAAQSQPQAQTSNQTESPSQPQPENGQQQSPQTPPQRPAGHRAPAPGDFMTLLLGSLFDPSGFVFNGNPDAVYSQEAFDRIITQLREANANSGGAPPASQSALDKLQTKEVDDEMLSSEEKPKCVICVDEMVKGDKASILPCNHLFHGECVTIWLKQHNTCPVCRRSIEEEVKATPAKTVDEFHTHGHQHERENAANSNTGCM